MGALALACLGGALALPFFGAPAFADDPADLRIEPTSGQVQLVTGKEPQTVTFVITNDGPGTATAPTANIDAPLDSRGVTIGGTSLACNPVNGPSVIACPLQQLAPGQNVTITIQLVPPASGGVGPGENVSEDGNAWVTNPNGSDPNGGNDGRTFGAVLRAGDSGGQVTEVSGSVMDAATGSGLAGATVEVTDNAETTGTTTTDAEGKFNYQPPTPLKAGRIKVRASKDGYEVSRTSVNAENGGSVTDVQLAVSPIEGAATPTPSAVPTPTPTPVATAAAAASTKGDDDSSVSFLVVLLVSLLALAVLAGGALWVGLRRNREQEPPPSGDEPSFRPRPPNLGDAPTVQLRAESLDALRAGGAPIGGTRVMTQFGQDPAVDATQQIPQPDRTSLIGAGGYSEAGGYPPPALPPIEYDQTAPFGPPTTQFDGAFGAPPTTQFGAPPPPAPPTTQFGAPLPDQTARFDAPDPMAGFQPPPPVSSAQGYDAPLPYAPPPSSAPPAYLPPPASGPPAYPPPPSSAPPAYAEPTAYADPSAFGAPTTFGAAPSSAPPAAAQPNYAEPNYAEPTYPAPPDYTQPASFGTPPASAPPAYAAPMPPAPPTYPAPTSQWDAPPPAAPPAQQPPPPAAPQPTWSNPPAPAGQPDSSRDWFSSPAAPPPPPLPPLPTSGGYPTSAPPAPPTLRVVTPGSTPEPGSPLTSQSGPIPPITALVAPTVQPADPPTPRPGTMPRPSLVLRPDEDLAPTLAPKAAGPPPTAFDPAPVRPGAEPQGTAYDPGRHAGNDLAQDGDSVPHHGRHSGN